MRNQLFEAIKFEGLDPRTCELEDGVKQGPMTIYQVEVRQAGSGSVFRFWPDDPHDEGWDQYRFSTAVGEAPTGQALNSVSWPEIIHQIRVWAEEVRDEVQAPDLWS